MYGREKRVLLREYLEQGLTKTALAVKLGLSRRTIHHWIETGQLDRDLDNEAVRYKKRPSTPRKIDPYCGIIHSRLEAFPELSAERVYRELRAAGYEGGYTQVKEYVRRVRPRPAPEPVVRFETPPGHQAQVDFAHFRFHGAGVGRCYWFWASRDCCGFGSSSARTCGRCSRDSKKRSVFSTEYPRRFCLTRCVRSSSRTGGGRGAR